jgi:hypothetical protein
LAFERSRRAEFLNSSSAGNDILRESQRSA